MEQQGFIFPMCLMFPPGNRHFYDPGRGYQENPQWRVRVLPLQPRTFVKNERERARVAPRVRPTRLALFATYPERLE